MTIVNDEKYIVWKDTFNTGYKRIDEQHEKFVGMLNRLYDINADKDLSNPKIRQEFNSVLKDTIDYMVYHFIKILLNIHQNIETSQIKYLMR